MEHVLWTAVIRVVKGVRIDFSVVLPFALCSQLSSLFEFISLAQVCSQPILRDLIAVLDDGLVDLHLTHMDVIDRRL